MKKNIIISFVSLFALALLHLLSLKYEPIDAFFKGVLGALIITILASAVFVPHLERLISFGRKRPYINRVFDELRYLVARGEELASPVHEKHFLKLFKRHKITPGLLESLVPEEAAVFILGLQFYHRHLDLSPDVDLFELIKVAEKASLCDDYISILLAASLKGDLLPDEDTLKFADQLLKRKSGFLKVRYKSEDADSKFFERLKNTDGERIYIFSTTSQISNLSFDLIRQYATGIRELNLYMVSPLIRTHTALRELLKEYNLPDFAIPRGQFIDQSPHFDMLRRVLRILIAVDIILDFQKATGIRINLYFFTHRYPNVKVRLLDERSYLQILPGCLKYANNIYRFGIELTDKDLIDLIRGKIDKFTNDETKVQKIPLDDVNVREIRYRALREIYLYLLSNDQPISELETLRSSLDLVLKSPFTSTYVSMIVELDQLVSRTISEYSFKPAGRSISKSEIIFKSIGEPNENRIVVTRTSTNEPQHVSVGMLFIHDGKLLLIEKNKAPYTNKLSIVAGHVEEDESPKVAIIREVGEELGIDIADFHLIQDYENMPGDICKYKCHNHRWFVFMSEKVTETNTLVPCVEEIASYRWVTFEELAKLENLTFASRSILEDLGLL